MWPLSTDDALHMIEVRLANPVHPLRGSQRRPARCMAQKLDPAIVQRARVDRGLIKACKHCRPFLFPFFAHKNGDPAVPVAGR